MTFLDTNILFYAADSREREKHRIACDAVEHVALLGQGVISSQVVIELAANLVKKLKASPLAVQAQMSRLAQMKCVALDTMLIHSAMEIYARYQLSIWDSAIVAAALESKCRLLLSEDLQHGLEVENLTVINPFLIMA